jgi:para-aminobenzoate synthetase component 1
LRFSEKEQAELIMITDLVRNDLGRVCAYGSIQVAELRAIASYANVHHAYSRVSGHLRPGVDLVDLLQATFPGGSVTGAPKIRAMEIIEELEPTARGPYCGAIGYIGVDGTMDLSIAIRTVLCEGSRLTFQVGGGIVAESRPADEFDETHHKAKSILEALGSNVDEIVK